jgi:Rps23 Pro-64 3,4-dihydroxylase Tpa1-like proline 4-hydroxylase
VLNQSVLENRDEISQGLKRPYFAIDNALQSGFAEDLRDELLTSQLWQAQDQRVMPERQGQNVAEDLKYSRKGIILGDPRTPAKLEALHRYLNSSPALEWFSDISGRKCHSFEGVATIFRPGDHISRHNDLYTRKTGGGKTQSRAVTFNCWLTKDWIPDFGGRLIWEKPYAEIIPTFNTLLIFRPTELSQHWVEPVAEFVTIPRLTISGWFMTNHAIKADRLKLNIG